MLADISLIQFNLTLDIFPDVELFLLILKLEAFNRLLHFVVQLQGRICDSAVSIVDDLLILLDTLL
ncbi:hypothetical protein D3C75_680620 [compost metagenome]